MLRCFPLLLLFATVVSQRRTQTSGQFTITASGSDISELSSSVQNSFETAFAQISSDGDSLQRAVNELAANLAQAIAKIMITIVSSSDIDAAAEANLISQAVGQALLAASNTASGEFSNLNIDSITLDVRNAVQTTLSGATSNSDPAQLTQEIAVQVLNSVGNALAEVTGGSFEANVQVNATSTPSVITFISTSGNTAELQTNLQAALGEGNITLATSILINLLSQSGFNQFSTVLIDGLSSGEVIQKNRLINLIAGAVSEPNFPAWPFTDAIAVAYGQNSKLVADYLKNVLLKVQTAGGLAESIAFAYQRGGEARAAFDEAISQAISGNGCNSVKSILDEATVYAQQKGVASQFSQQLQENSDIAKCTSGGVGVVVSIELFGSFSNPRRAATQIKEAATQGREDAIARTITTGVQQGERQNVVQTLILIFQDESVPVSPLVNAISTAITIGGPNVEATIIDLIKEIAAQSGINTQFTIALALAFAPGKVEATDAFTKVIAGHLEGDECPLKDHMEAALSSTSGDDRDAFVKVITSSDDLSKCVGADLLSEPAPAPSPLPVTGCTDIAPDDRYTCAQQKEFGKCENQWMITGGYCETTCGRCAAAPATSTSPSTGLSPIVSEDDTVLDIISKTNRVSTLLGALEAADLDDMLTRVTGEYTVLAPTNAAFQAILERLDITLQDLVANKPLLEEIVGYHVIPTQYLSRDFTDGQVLITINQPETLTVKINGQTDFIGTASVGKLLVPDLVGSNGVVHIVDSVLLPIRPVEVTAMQEAASAVPASPDAPTPDTTITEVIEGDDTLGTLSLVLEAAGLNTVLSNPNAKYTVFAPTDAAFANALSLLDVTPEELAQDLRTLRTILRFHIANGEYLEPMLENGLSISTLNVPQRVTIQTDSSDKITVVGPQNQGVIQLPSQRAGNGVVHTIDAVLLPFSPDVTPSVSTVPTKTIMGIIEESPELSSLAAALKQANLDTALNDNSKKYTLFAPTDDAFEDFPQTLDQILNLGSDLTNLLQLHVVSSEIPSPELREGRELTTLLTDQTLTISIPNAIIVEGPMNEGEIMIPDVPATNGIIHFIDSILLPSALGGNVAVSGSCTDISPDDRYTCEDQSKFGKCDAAWMIAGEFCKRTCGRCGDVVPVEMSPVSVISNNIEDDTCECSCGCCLGDPEDVGAQVEAMFRDQLTAALKAARG
eukprot:TRINITY_DN1133_c1_g1_i6.p1 TRINITY_DN1133_c1_g1~~TRINITY_DN1133_c1_g1_i6.p1  ORF type:complete len:1190 (-),score=221.72 TRINITY_DN1133_c1_g1_i6:342-3911(-)